MPAPPVAVPRQPHSATGGDDVALHPSALSLPATIYSVGLSGYKSIAQHTQIHLVAIGAPLASLDSHIDSRRLLKTLGAYDLQLQLFFRGSRAHSRRVEPGRAAQVLLGRIMAAGRTAANRFGVQDFVSLSRT